MNLYFRFIFAVIRAFFKKRLRSPLDETSLNFWVLPTDLDLNGHMNNGRYLTIMDIGRMDYVIQLGIGTYALKHGYIPVLSGATIRYRLPLLPFQKYVLKTRSICWDEKWVYMEHRFVIAGGKKDNAVAAIALVKGGFFDRKNHKTIPTGQILEATGYSVTSPPIPAYIQKWTDSEETLRDEMLQQSA